MTARETVEAISDGINALHAILALVGQSPASPVTSGTPLELAGRFDRLIDALAEITASEHLQSSYRPTPEDLARFRRLRTFVRLWADSGAATTDLVGNTEECLDLRRVNLGSASR